LKNKVLKILKKEKKCQYAKPRMTLNIANGMRDCGFKGD
jgi:hypothetical protein